MRGAPRATRLSLAFLAIFALLLGFLMPQQAAAQDETAEATTTQQATESEEQPTATPTKAPAAEEPEPEPAPVPSTQTSEPKPSVTTEKPTETSTAAPETTEEKPSARASRMVNDPLVANEPGQLQPSSTRFNWRHNFIVGGPGTPQADSAVRLDKLTYTYDYSGANSLNYFEEQSNRECVSNPGNPNGACIGVIIGNPGDINYLNSFEQKPVKQSGLAGNWLFTWNGYNLSLDTSGRRFEIDLPGDFVVPPGTPVSIVYAWNSGLRPNPPQDQQKASIPNFTVEGNFVAPLDQPTSQPRCVVSTVYNGNDLYKTSNGQTISNTSTNLFKQSLGKRDFDLIGNNGWKYNAMAYNYNNGKIYAVSQVLDDAHPPAHLLAIDPTNGNAQDLGKIYGFVPPGTPRPGTNQTMNDEELINTGFFTPDGHYWVANAASSGSGTMYDVNLTTGLASRVPLKMGVGVNLTSRGALPSANDYTFVQGNSNYAFGLVNQQKGYTQSPVLERITLTGPDRGTIDRFDLRGVRSQFGESLPDADFTTGSLRYQIYGAAWTTGSGLLSFDNNAGGAYQFTIANPGGTSPSVQLVGIADAPSNSNNDGTSCISGAKPDLEIKKAAASTKNQGKDITWSIAVKNIGGGFSSGFRLDDRIPASFQDIQVTPPEGMQCRLVDVQGEATGGKAVQCYGGILDVGQSVTVTISANIVDGKKCESNSATVAGQDPDPVSGNNTSTADCPKDQFWVAKRPSADQDPQKDGTQQLATVTVGANNQATVTAYYDIEAHNGNLSASVLPVDIQDTLSFPTWLAPASVEAKIGDRVLQGVVLNGSSFTIPAASVQEIPSDSSVIITLKVTTKPVALADLSDTGRRTELTCVAGTPPNSDNKNGLFNQVDLVGELDPQGTSNNQACVTPDLPSKNLSIEKSPRPGQAVQANPDGTATLTYTIKLNNIDPIRSAISGRVFEDVALPANVTANGDVSVTLEKTSETQVTGLVSSIPKSKFVAGQRVVLATNVQLPPSSQATFTLKVPVIINPNVAQSYQPLVTCEPDGSNPRGVHNRTAMDWSDSNGPDNNDACIPIIRANDADISLQKIAYDPEGDDVTPEPLTGAQFAIFKEEANGQMSAEPLIGSLTVSPTDPSKFTTKLPVGKYYLVETRAPEGRSLLSQPVPFELTGKADGYGIVMREQVQNATLIQASAPGGNKIQLVVADAEQGKLPKTGGSGILPYLLGGLLAVAGLAWAAGPNRRRN